MRFFFICRLDSFRFGQLRYVGTHKRKSLSCGYKKTARGPVPKGLREKTAQMRPGGAFTAATQGRIRPGPPNWAFKKAPNLVNINWSIMLFWPQYGNIQLAGLAGLIPIYGKVNGQIQIQSPTDIRRFAGSHTVAGYSIRRINGMDTHGRHRSCRRCRRSCRGRWRRGRR